MFPKTQETADLVIFIQEMFHGKLHFFVQCSQFHISRFSGCGGNGNNFKTMMECLMKCARQVTTITATTTTSPMVENEFDCNSDYGCCSDNVTPARESGKLDCPGMCRGVFRTMSNIYDGAFL